MAGCRTCLFSSKNIRGSDLKKCKDWQLAREERDYSICNFTFLPRAAVIIIIINTHIYSTVPS